MAANLVKSGHAVAGFDLIDARRARRAAGALDEHSPEATRLRAQAK